MGRVWRTALAAITVLACSLYFLNGFLGQSQGGGGVSKAHDLNHRSIKTSSVYEERRQGVRGSLRNESTVIYQRVQVSGTELNKRLDGILLDHLRASQLYMERHPPPKRAPPRKLTKSDLSKHADLTDRAEAETQLSENAADSPSQDNYDQYDPGPLADKSDLQEAEEADDYYDDDDDASDVINDDDDVEDLFDDDVEGDNDDAVEDDDSNDDLNEDDLETYNDNENEANDYNDENHEHEDIEPNIGKPAARSQKDKPALDARTNHEPAKTQKENPASDARTNHAEESKAAVPSVVEGQRLREIREMHAKILKDKQALEALQRAQQQAGASLQRIQENADAPLQGENRVASEDAEELSENETAPKGFSFSEFWSREPLQPDLSTRTSPATTRKVAAALNARFQKSNATTPFATVCPDARRPKIDAIEKKETWQVMRSDDEMNTQKLFLYSAYYDARLTITPIPVIRIFIVVPSQYIKGGARCMVWYESRVQPVEFPAKIERLSRQRKNIMNNVIYSMYMLVCRLPVDSPVPRHVSVTRTRCAIPRTLLPVRLPDLDGPKHDFGVCVVGQWGSMSDSDSIFLVEWLELHKMFGVGEVNIYNISMRVGEKVQHVIDHYTTSGFLRVHQQRSPVPYTTPGKEYDSSQLCLRTTLNDCLQRNAFRYKYISVVDRDEIIVPRIGSDYKEMMNAMLSNEPKLRKAPAIIHFNGEFFMNLGQDPTQPYYIASLSYLNRTVVEQPHFLNFIPGKSFVNPRYCAVAWNHHCQIPWQPKLMAPRRYSLVHHYRKGCEVASRKEDIKTRNKICAEMKPVHDDFILGMRTQIKSRVDKALRTLRLDPKRLMQQGL